jgi:hypothetical protein
MSSLKRAFTLDIWGEKKRASLVACFADLPNQRVVGRTDHDQLDIVIVAL